MLRTRGVQGVASSSMSSPAIATIRQHLPSISPAALHCPSTLRRRMVSWPSTSTLRPAALHRSCGCSRSALQRSRNAPLHLSPSDRKLAQSARAGAKHDIFSHEYQRV